jgi:hypothetical protein
MHFENVIPAQENEPHWLSFEEIVEKMSSFIEIEKCSSPRIEKREDGIVKLVEYEVKDEDGNTSVFGYRIKGPRSSNTTIDIAHFEGNPDDGNWLGGGGTLSNYDEVAGKWTDVEGVK